MYFRGGSAPAQRSRNVTAVSSPVMLDSKRPVTAAGEKSELTDLNLALRFNRQVNVTDDEFDVIGSDLQADVHSNETQVSEKSTSQHLFSSETNRSRKALALNDAVKAAIKTNLLRGTSGPPDSRPEARAENRKSTSIKNNSTSRPSSTKDTSGAYRTKDYRAQSASMISAAATYGSTSKARFITSMKTTKPLSPYISSSPQSSPYIHRSSSAKTGKPKETKPRRTDHAQPTVSSSEKVKDSSKDLSKSTKAINGAAATLLATTKTKHPNILLRAFSVHTDSDSLATDSTTPSSSQVSTPGRSSSGEAESELTLQSSRSTESAEAHREDVRSASRGRERRAATAKDIHVSASLGALDGVRSTTKARPKSRKLYLGVDQDDCSIDSEDLNIRRSASFDMLETSYEDLERPPSRQKVAAQHLFENLVSELDNPPLNVEIMKPGLQPRARSANATLASDVFVTENHREISNTVPAVGRNDPFSDGFEELEVPNAHGPFRTIVSLPSVVILIKRTG